MPLVAIRNYFFNNYLIGDVNFMLEMIKKFLCILLLNLFGLNLGYTATTPPALRPRCFFIFKASSTLKKQEKNLRKHVIDVLLSTQKYNVVFSKIPKIISKGDVSQQILKYKLRTSVISDSLFDVEYFLIDADNIRIIKKIKYIDIPKVNYSIPFVYTYMNLF